MHPDPAAVAARHDLARPLAAALALPALDRRPDGGRLVTHRMIVDATGLWLVPRVLAARPPRPDRRLPAMIRDLVWSGPPLPDPSLYWLAHAARQRAWRAMARVPGPGPVVHLAVTGPASVRLAVAMPGLPGRPAPAGIPARLEAAFGRAAVARDLAWAARRRGPSTQRP